MATVIPVPTLSTQGFVSDLAGKLDTLLAHFFLSDYNQTQLYPGRVTSLPELIQRCGGDAAQAGTLIQQALTTYLGAYYPSIQVDVTPRTPLDLDPSIKVELLLQIALNEVGSVASFKRLLQAEDSKMSRIIKLNND